MYFSLYHRWRLVVYLLDKKKKCKITHWLSQGSFLDLIFQLGLHRFLGDVGSLVIAPVYNPGDLQRIRSGVFAPFVRSHAQRTTFSVVCVHKLWR